MKTIIFTMGTRGDVQPYIYLAKALIEKGHNVTIGTHPCWKSLVSNAGVEFAEVGKDIDIEKEAAVIRGKNGNPAISMLKTMNFVFRIIEESTPDIFELCKLQDLIIVSHSLMGATEAEKLGKPTVNVVLQTEMLPLVKKKKTLKEKLFALMINPQMVKPYNRIRKAYDMEPLKSMDKVISGTAVLIPISPKISRPNIYWDDKVEMTGYWFDKWEFNYKPDEELLDFLNGGKKPVILALGAMSFEYKSEIRKLDMFVKAFSKCGMRAIIQGFNESIKDYVLPNTMYHVEAIPHSWLFRQGYAVIHHCGFGTATSAMMYGVPSIPVPHVLDQFGFAQQLWKLGVSTEPIKSKDLKEENIASAIEYLKNNYEKIKGNTETISIQLTSEHGLERAVEIIESCI